VGTNKFIRIIWEGASPSPSPPEKVNKFKQTARSVNKYQIIAKIGRVHVPEKPIHTAGHVYRHFDNDNGYQSTRYTVMSSLGHLVTSKHYEWAMLNYTCEADEAGNGYTASFVAVEIFSGHPMIRPPKLRLRVQNSVGMQIFRVTTIVQNLGAPDP